MSVHGCGQAVAVEGGGGHCVSVCLSVGPARCKSDMQRSLRRCGSPLSILI